MGQHRTRAWSEAASPGSCDTEVGSGTVTQSRFGNGHSWARGQKESMHNEEKGEGVKEEEPMKKRKEGTKRMKR